MTAAFGTLPFLATLWLLVVLGARVLEESGAKIAAALKGVPTPESAIVKMRAHGRTRRQQIRSVERRLRAAA